MGVNENKDFLQIRNSTKKFDTVTAINDISLDFQKGKIYGIVGTNGSGKSTLLRLISGVYKTDSGSITFDGENVFDNAKSKSNIVFLPDEPYFVTGATMKKMASTYKLLYPNFDRNRFEHLMETFHFSYTANIQHMSKGQKRQAAIILSLSVLSPLILLDESFDGLDPVIRSLVKKIVYEDVEKNNISYIITSHSLKELEEICDNIILLHNGEILLNETLDDTEKLYSKVQIALNKEISMNDFENIDLEILEFSSSGKIANIIFSNTNDECLSKLSVLSPIILEVNALTLDEIFIIKAKQSGYSFDLIEEF